MQSCNELTFDFKDAKPGVLAHFERWQKSLYPSTTAPAMDIRILTYKALPHLAYQMQLDDSDRRPRGKCRTGMAFTRTDFKGCVLHSVGHSSIEEDLHSFEYTGFNPPLVLS